MLHCTVKFCGGCNPRYDRGAAYQQIRSALVDCAEFTLPVDGQQYDVLLILRGCTGCPYLYEEIDAAHRVICVCAEDIESCIQSIKSL